ncbi:MAG: GAF domain-containing protein, partial [Chloroflexi bacterium]|nr:GAF domain-containing protein [Chloroflexota bacterium]
LQAAARRAAVARHLQGEVETSLLQSVVDAAAILFDAEAASIALFERDPERLEFRVAAGAHGAGVVGVAVPPTKGIVGYVYSTGQAMALSDVMSDPRFDRATADRTGYVPRSIAAVPLIDGALTVGVLQVLDKQSAASFGLRDMELLAVFAKQAATAIEASKVQRDISRLLRAAIVAVAADALDADAVEELVGVATAGLDADEATPFWSLVELLTRARSMSDRELLLVTEILGVVARLNARPRRT